MARDQTLLRQGLRLEYATLAWNVIGVTVLAVAAWRARSVALAGFGLDSGIEIFASLVVVWELTGDEHPQRQQRALRMIGTAFVLLAIYLTGQAGWVLATGFEAATSTEGIVWTAATCAVMVGLAQGKRITGNKMGNPVLISEGKVTMVDAILAGAVTVGLGLRATLGWWWADPLAGLVIVAYAIKEARSLLTSEQPPVVAA